MAFGAWRPIRELSAVYLMATTASIARAAQSIEVASLSGHLKAILCSRPVLWHSER
jgi:ABC-type uncharacterized transport system permease subunit